MHTAEQFNQASRTFALIDCNNFFVSCERLFRPDLEQKPVVVLSNNDGVVIARSNQAKQLSIPMGAPVFKYKTLFKQQGVIQFSANFELYGNISARIVELLAKASPKIEVYSIDEAFLDITNLPIADYQKWGNKLGQRIQKQIGIPVSVGIAPTKTLAKLAAEHAKQGQTDNAATYIAPTAATPFNTKGSTFNLFGGVLRATPIEKVWGVGRQLAPKLRTEGLATAYDLRRLTSGCARQLMGIHGRRMVAELNGISCYPLGPEDKAVKSIARGRTFGQNTSDFYAVLSAIASFAARAAYRLRQSRQLTKGLSVILTAAQHTNNGKQQFVKSIRLNQPTADTGVLTSAAVNLVQQIHNPSLLYHRAGIFLYDFIDDKTLQTDLLGRVNVSSHDSSTRRMQALDQINRRFGRDKLVFGAARMNQAWQSKKSNASPRYTTDINELPKTRIAF